MLRYLGQAVFHSLIAAVVTEALLRVWTVEQAGARLTCRLLALTLPLLALPLFLVLAPFRSAPWFAERCAVLSIGRWNQIQLAGIGLDGAAVVILGAVGVTLFLLDFLPALRSWLIDRALPIRDELATIDRLDGHLKRLAARCKGPMPSIRLVQSPAPILLCMGLVRRRLVVSTGAMATLDDNQLRGAIAHELIHAHHGDPLLSWILMAVRTLFFFSPATQFVARSAVDELERRADDLGAALAGERLGLAGALIRLFTAQHPGSRPLTETRRSAARRVSAWLHLGRTSAVERRCRRLLSPHPPRPVPGWPVHVTLVGVSLVVLLFFVV